MATKKAKKTKKRSKTGDRLPDLPGSDVLYTGGRYSAAGLLAAAAVNPYVAAAIGTGLGTYAMMENTERLWGPRVEAHAQRTRDRFRKDTSTALVPSSAWDIPEAWGYQARAPIGPPAPATVKRTRKVSKANKATKKAYRFLADNSKGKMTQKKCCDLLKKAASMASKANPATKSRIGKGNTPMKRECRKIRKDIWKTTKRY